MSTQPHEQKPSVASRLAGDVYHMPRWQKAFLGGALILLIAGVAGQVFDHLSPKPPVTQTTAAPRGSAVSTPPGGSSGFISGSPTISPTITPTPQSTTDDSSTDSSSAAATHAPWMTAVGGGFVGGYLIGWMFRIFIKTMLLLTLAGGAIIGGLSYFHVINVDMTAAREKYDSNSAWLYSQADKLRDVALAHLPSSGTGLTGLLMGLKRR